MFSYKACLALGVIFVARCAASIDSLYKDQLCPNMRNVVKDCMLNKECLDSVEDKLDQMQELTKMLQVLINRAPLNLFQKCDKALVEPEKCDTVPSDINRDCHVENIYMLTNGYCCLGEVLDEKHFYQVADIINDVMTLK